MMAYHSEIELGQRYRDTDTAYEGVASQVTFRRNGCERVELRAMVSHVPDERWFDAPQLELVTNGKVMGFGQRK